VGGAPGPGGSRSRRGSLLALVLVLCQVASAQQQAGSIRGLVLDRDFDAPLAAAQVLIVEIGEKTTSTDQGNYVFPQVAPGRYTLVFSKPGYVRQVRADVPVSAGQLTEVNVSLPGEFEELEEFVVQDILSGAAGAEAALLELRLESPSIMDSISADLMSRAGASDAASALTLVSGATVTDGKFAVIRGLPDRYVSSQMNGVRLPSADEDTRAVELDQFPAAVIDSINVTKSFTPDQQGDASGGAVDVRLKGIPDETILQIGTEVSYNTQVTGRSDFLTYQGGGLDTFGKAGSDKEIQFDNIGGNWDGAVGVVEDDAPYDYKLSGAFGGRTETGDGITYGGFASLFYERDSAFFDDATDDSYWVTEPGAGLTPTTLQGVPQPGADPPGAEGDFKTALFDVQQARESVQWGGLGTLGMETDRHELGLTYLYTHTAEDEATLAIDTRGKEHYFPGYDPDDPMGTGNEPDNINAAPYIRTETLVYTERTTDTLQLHGEHTLDFEDVPLGESFFFHAPVVDWTVSNSTAKLDQPDKRQFGARWLAPSFDPGNPVFGVPPSTSDPEWFPFKPSAFITLGNLQRIWKKIEEQSDQYSINLELPFERWDGEEGYVKFGVFDDQVKRSFDQESFSNTVDVGASFVGGFEQPWSEVFPDEDHAINESLTDVDYRGNIDLSAWYGMIDLPLTTKLSLVTGARFESTDIAIMNSPEEDATWFPPGATAPVDLAPGSGDADVDFSQDDVLPSVGLIYDATDEVTLRLSWAKTVARQTFKELTPILQTEFLGGPIFIGNPELQMASLENWDLRADYRPYPGSLLSASWFTKDIDDPIEYVQRLAGFSFTQPVNYPEGELSGYELEARQELGRLWDPAEGFSVGANATFIDSKVQLTQEEITVFSGPAIDIPLTSRDMTNAPEHLYNIFLTWDLDHIGTEFALFYTVKGDTLVAGAGESQGNFIPSVYEREYDTLNFSVSHDLSERSTLKFQIKNITNPKIEEYYSGEHTGGPDVTRTSYTRGREFALGLTVRF
jgi:TonB-dependent receptor